MDRRLMLHELLCGVLGSSHCYFQPPESLKLTYPCIVYSRGSGSNSTEYADDYPYTFTQSYELTVIDKDPDSGLITKLAMAFPTIRFNRHFTSDNLNHDVFSLYY